MKRLDRAKVAAVEGEDGGDVEPFGDGNEEGVDGAEGEVPVLPYELGGAEVVRRFSVDDWDAPVRQRAEEDLLFPQTAFPDEKVGDLGDDNRRNGDGFSGFTYETEARDVVWITVVQNGNRRGCVGQDHLGGAAG